MSSIRDYLHNPIRIVLSLANHELINWVPDKVFLSMAYKARLGRPLRWNRLETFNEKQQWLKLHDRKEAYTAMVDKYAVRNYISEKIGTEYLIPLYGVWSHVNEIDYSSLPSEFVIKCTHDSGSAVICRSKEDLNITEVNKLLHKALKRNFYWHSREWPYKNVPHRIIAEALLKQKNGDEIVDYKLQCFNGCFDNTLICTGRFSKTGVRYYYFDRDWKLLPYSIHNSEAQDFDRLKPQKYSEMIRLAEKLSEGIPQLRVDLYEVDGKIYFGELTFFSQGGCDSTITEEADLILGRKLKLPIDQ